MGPGFDSRIQVAWIKSDSKAILAIHTHLVAHNPRLSVTHNGHNTWKLHVSLVQKNDSGTYMCQINTDPMRSQRSINAFQFQNMPRLTYFVLVIMARSGLGVSNVPLRWPESSWAIEISSGVLVAQYTPDFYIYLSKEDIGK
uniref:Ig-like domain-containing protein n=1 Tax=Timema bartmani TaxID=61472 RepID=A0A7R9EPW8_9NEOP|nr:unnamed protein product [Timema bartmani]